MLTLWRRGNEGFPEILFGVWLVLSGREHLFDGRGEEEVGNQEGQQGRGWELSVLQESKVFHLQAQADRVSDVPVRRVGGKGKVMLGSVGALSRFEGLW